MLRKAYRLLSPVEGRARDAKVSQRPSLIVRG